MLVSFFSSLLPWMPLVTSMLVPTHTHPTNMFNCPLNFSITQLRQVWQHKRRVEILPHRQTLFLLPRWAAVAEGNGGVDLCLRPAGGQPWRCHKASVREHVRRWAMDKRGLGGGGHRGGDNGGGRVEGGCSGGELEERERWWGGGGRDCVKKKKI